jgi:flagellin
LQAENALTNTASALDSTLQQLSSGSRINAGADDAAGLAIANGLQANVTALSQSVSNANDGIGELQLADGALAQVTTLLNRAITLATESGTGTVSDPQRVALQAEYTSILAEINRIGSSTTYNGQQVFTSGTAPNLNAQDSPTSSLTLGTALTVGGTTTVSAGGASYTYTAAAGVGNPNVDTSTGTALTAATVLGSVGNANTQVSAGTAQTTGSTLASSSILTITRGGVATTYTTTASSTATVATLIAAINTGTTQGATTTGVVVAGGAATGLTASVTAGGQLLITDTANNGNIAVTGNITTGTTGYADQSGTAATLSITHGTATTTYTTAASSTATVATLLAAINTGITQGSGAGIVTVGGTVGGALSAAVVGGQIQVTDTVGNNNISITGGTSLDTGTTGFAASSAPTVQNLINAINNDTTVGAKASLVGGSLVITDPQFRNNLVASTTDTVVGALVAGAPTLFTTPNTVGTTSKNLNELQGNAVNALTATTVLTTGGVTSFTDGGKVFTFTASAGQTVGALISAINNPTTDPAGLQAFIGTTGTQTGQLVVTDPNDHNDIAVNTTNTETVLGTLTNPSVTASATTDIFLSDDTVVGSSQIGVTFGSLTTAGITNGTGGSAVNLNAAGADILTQTDAQSTLNLISAAIANIASVRGTLGATVNRLTAASNVLNSQVINLTSAENTITAADIPTVVANLTKYSILEQTGISALAQANQQQQLVLKLLQ